jgi:(1->4)-alpha-D-glucan 1-alpha-D-glucosylmutase
MAKAVEDTLFYRHNPLIARNEVGCDPLEPPAGPEAVHRALDARRAEPHALTATATHDTKRGEGARARLHTLAEAPDAWIRLFEGLSTPEGPPRDVQWLMLQAMAGAWGSADLAERFEEYVVKALREAKVATSWTEPDEAFEAEAVDWAVSRIRDGSFAAGFEGAIGPFVEAGEIGALAQTVLKVAVPGVPDVYQGTEAGDLSLVDPDNRRQPDWDRLGRLIEAGSEGPEGRHARVLHAALGARAERPALFARGAYRPLAVPQGAFAFERSLGEDRAVVIVPIRPLALVADGTGLWGDAVLEETAGLHPRLAERPQSTRLADLLWPLPVALMTSWAPEASSGA